MTELAAWYQKKIGTYDKQEWETTIEQRILHGLTRVPLKSAKLRPDLIDVDLIRGSSFPKAKPVQGLGTVVRLALARVLLLPLWMSWWAAHTSAPAARLLLALWLLQCINTVLYFAAPSSVHLDATCILVPLFLMGGLGVVHALIVSTAPPRPPSHRYRSLSNDERRQGCGLSVWPERGILRKDNLPPDALQVAPEVSQKNEFYSTEEKNVTSVSTQTRETAEEDKTEEKQGEWRRDFILPSVSLTPPSCGQSVSFVLGGRRLACGESSREDEGESPVHAPRQRNENPRNPTASAEGDDGFESLNGNNSNGSENGDELLFYGEDDEVKDGHESDEENEDEKDEERMNLCDKIPNGILYESKLRKRIKLRKCDLDEKSCDREGEESRDKWTENSVVFEEVSVGSESTVRRGGGLRACSDGGSSTNLSAEQDNRRERRCKTGAGVRFRNSWVQELLEHRNSLTDGATRKTRKDCTSCPSSSEEECDTASASLGASQHADWVGQTTNSEECSYSSEPEESEWEGRADPSWEPCAILSPASDRVSCTIWERGRVLKAPLSAVDISRAVVHRAERALARCSGDLWPGPALLAPLLAALPIVTRLIQVLVDSEAAGSENVTVWDLPVIFFVNSPLHTLFAAFGGTVWERVMTLISALSRLGLGALVFFLLAVAERAFRQRFFYAKLFSHLTSARRARQSSLPHFRLNRVRNIKTWLSVRSYLKRRGPQRSVDVIVSAAFFMMVLLISYLVIELLKETGQTESSRTAEALGWALALGAVLLRLAALGTRAARKHRCLPVLLTEQINLHLAMERRPASKERLAVANNVLKLASDLLKELESPFKISGLSANPYLYTITKVVVLSALSGVLSEILGFKLKLHKIKIK